MPAYRTRSAEMYLLLRHPDGPTGRHITKLAREVKAQAKADARRLLRSPYTNPYRRTGAYERSFEVTSIRQESRGPRIRILNTDDKAVLLERGAPRHTIRPRNRRGYMRFYWQRIRKPVRLKVVDHPGIRAYRILENALDRVIKRQR